MNARIVRRVIAGGLWLSMVEPGWQDRIDWGRLDLSNIHDCVAGQVFSGQVADLADSDPWAPPYSGYDVLRYGFGLNPAERAALGFTTDDEDDQAEGNPWADLEYTWRTLWGPAD